MRGARDILNDGLRMTVAIASLASAIVAGGAVAVAGTETYPLVFPVAGENSWSDTWGAPRSEGRTHKGTDIFAAKGTPVVAAADGVIKRIDIGKRSGRYIVVSHDDGWSSYYIHLDNDTPGTDDGLGGNTAPGIALGVRVAAGDVIDYVGDSGNAEETPSHLHFELHQPDGSAVNPSPHLRAAGTEMDVEPLPTFAQDAVARVSYRAAGTELVGHSDPGGGFAAGLAVSNGMAYVGSWGRPEICPNTGVRIIDVRDPAVPKVIGSVAGATEFPGTSTEGLWVGSVATDEFVGDIAVVGIRLCDTSEHSRRGDAFRGLAIYDVDDPQSPRLMSTFGSGAMTQGVNDVTATVRPDGTLLVSATVMQSYLHTDGKLGDWRLLDATDPYQPIHLADWDYRAEYDESDPAAGEIGLHVHSSTLAVDGSAVWLSGWDAGVVRLSLDDPVSPVVAGAVRGGAEAPGNVHSVAHDPNSGLLILGSEHLEKKTGSAPPALLGGQMLFDAAGLEQITPVGAYATNNTPTEDTPAGQPGYFSSHEIVLMGDLEYVSWYSDGLRVVSVADPAAPVEVASFIPPPTPDPLRHFTGQGRGTSFAMVWGVAVSDGLIYLTDMNSGLWIVRLAAEGEAGRTPAM